MEVEALEQAHFLERGLDERLRLILLCELGKMLRQRPGVRADPHRDARASCRLDDERDLVGPPMLPGLIRTAATPPSIALSARLALK